MMASRFPTLVRWVSLVLTAAAPALAPAEIAAPTGDALLQAVVGGADVTAAREAAYERLVADSSTALIDPAAAVTLHEAAYAHRLAGLLDALPRSKHAAAARCLAEHPATARELAFLTGEHDNPKVVLEVLQRLAAAFPQLDTTPGLAAALCVVHDRPIARHINEAHVRTSGPEAVYRHLVGHAGALGFGLTDVPGPLWVWVVNNTATPGDMAWAANQYPRHRAVGKLFYDIDYDYAHLNQGTAKAVIEKGYSLPNLRKFGGVCADQAYFAVSVAKSIGVPAVYTVGKGTDVSHAWVGYLRVEGGRAVWDFDNGRYEAYQHVRGEVEDPQTGKKIDDSTVRLMAETLAVPRAERYAAAAWVDAAAALRKAPDPTPATTTQLLALLEKGLRLNVAELRGWMAVADLAKQGAMSAKQKRTWADAVVRLCGDRYADFGVAVLDPIVGSIADPTAQGKLWDRLTKIYADRVDLSVELQLRQAQMWRDAGDHGRAGRGYQRVIQAGVNTSPQALTALDQAADLLLKNGRANRRTDLYAMAWKIVQPPANYDERFRRASNFYRIGMRYAELLESAGRQPDAERVRRAVKANQR